MTTETTNPAASEAVPALRTSITARINGVDRVCEIRRKDLRFFESIYGSSLALFNRIRGSEWSVEDVRGIVEFAVCASLKDDETLESFRMIFITTGARRREASAWIDEAFDIWGPANYVPLALGIIASALWGVPAEDAVFTDGSELIEPFDGD